MARVEDEWIHTFAKQTETIWKRHDWATMLGLPSKGSGHGYTTEQVADLPSFEIDALLSYYTSVRKTTLEYLTLLSGTDLETTPQPSRKPGYTVGRMFSHIIVEESQHVGQIAYLRGIQRGLNK